MYGGATVLSWHLKTHVKSNRRKKKGSKVALGCQDCGRAFTDRAALKKHQHMHKSKKFKEGFPKLMLKSFRSTLLLCFLPGVLCQKGGSGEARQEQAQVIEIEIN